MDGSNSNLRGYLGGILSGVLLVSAAAGAQTLPSGPALNFGPTYRQSLYVNSASFASRFTPSMVERVVANTAAAWSEYGSARRAFQFQGVSTGTTCVSGQHLVRAVSAVPCNPLNCDCAKFGDACYAGYHSTCGTGSQVVVNLNSGIPWASGIWAPPLQTALSAVISHELGHNLVNPNLNGISNFPGHVPATDPSVPEVMNYDSSLHSGTDFGLSDVEYAANYVGSSAGQDPIQRYRQVSSGFPLPLTYPWTALPSPGAGGWGGFDVSFGNVGTVRRSSMFLAASDSSSKLSDFDESSGSFTAGSATLVTRRSTSSLYDPDHKMWWVFVNERGVNEDEPFRIHIFRSTDRISWIDLGILQAPGQRIAKTRHPVGAAYDPTSQQVVVVYTTALLPSQAGAMSGCGDFQDGCNHELVGFVLPWNATTATVPTTARHRFSSNNSMGLGSMGAPAVACGTPTTSGNCEVLFVGMDAMLSIHFVPFQLGSSTIPSHGTAVNTGGLSDARLSYIGYQGKLIAACVGIANTVFVASKSSVGASLTWTELRTSVNGSTIPARRNPILRPRPEGTVDLFLINQ